MEKKLVCICNLVTEGEIKKVLAKGAECTADVQKATGAGTSCGRCLPEIDALVKEHNQNKRPNQQGTLKFDF